MKFTCEKYLLQSACTIASRATASKSPIPALEGLLIQADTDVRVTGYDLKEGIYTNIGADIEQTGSVVVGARLFGEMIRRLPPAIAASTGVDALCHAIECLTSRKATPFSSLYAMEALRLIFPNIESGNVFYKTITLFAKAETAGIIVTRTAIIINTAANFPEFILIIAGLLQTFFGAFNAARSCSSIS